MTPRSQKRDLGHPPVSAVPPGLTTVATCSQDCVLGYFQVAPFGAGAAKPGSHAGSKGPYLDSMSVGNKEGLRELVFVIITISCDNPAAGRTETSPGCCSWLFAHWWIERGPRNAAA